MLYIPVTIVPLGRGPWEVMLLIGKVGLGNFSKYCRGDSLSGAYSTEPLRACIVSASQPRYRSGDGAELCVYV